MFLKVVKRFIVSLFLVGVLSTVLILNIPASFAPQLISFASRHELLPADSPQLELAQLSGSLWDGTAKESALLINDNVIDLGQFSWQLDMAQFLDKEIVLQLQSSAPDHAVQAQVTFVQDGKVTVKSAEGYFPIKLLEPWIPLLIQGKLAFVIDHWIFTSRELIALDGVLNLEDADWLGGDEEMPLGSYMAQVSMQQQDLQIQINDFGAILGVDGMITVNAVSHYHFTASLQPREGLAPEVAESILWFGKRNSTGDILIDRRGKL